MNLHTKLSVQMLLDRLTYYINGKVFEWVMTICCLGIAFEIFFWPLVAHSGVFYWVSPVIREGGTGGMFLILGVARFYGLSMNGHHISGIRLGPWVRSIGSVLCAFVWGQFVVGLIQLSVNQGYPSPGIPLWATVTLGELYIAYRALANAR